MNELIKISTTQKGSQVVSARDIYAFVESREQFTDWMRRMLEFGFVQNVDYQILSVSAEKGRPSTDYALTLDTAKEIAMLQRNEKGRQARQYFIECEKRLRSSSQELSPLEVARRWVAAEEKKAELALQVASMQKKIDFVDHIMDADEKIDIGQAAKILELPFGRNTLFKELRDRGVFFKTRNEPKQEYIKSGYFKLKEVWVDKNGHDGFMFTKVLVTQKGLSFLSDLFKALPAKL